MARRSRFRYTRRGMNFFCRALLIAPLLFASSLPAQTEVDQRTSIQTVNSPRSFPKINTKAEWEEHARGIREQILVSCGLWPMPEKTPLNAKITGRVLRDGYSIEKVYFESYPGVFVAGNLYRPLSQGSGPFPGILNPHGHWDNGRMADEKEGSIAARCINFARQGMIALSYDMVGYNDTFFPDHPLASDKKNNFYERHRRFGSAPSHLLWNINLMGLQTWNSIRALDFLESLPDVDKTRLACTGESGGGTQTYMLGAIDDRVVVQAPVVMVSHTMQGGCSCENAPGLRIHYSNMEIAACAAPRPQIIVGATGDWTRDTTTVEGPAIEQIYKLFGAESMLRYETFDFRHNYNQTSREAVYDFFGSTLKPNRPASKETSYTKELDTDLLVFPDGKLPVHAKKESELISFLIAQSQSQLAKLAPSDKKSLATFKQTMLPAWRHTLQVEEKNQVIAQSIYLKTSTNYTAEKLFLGRKDRGDKIPAILFSPIEKAHRWTVVLVHPQGKSAFLGKNAEPSGLALALVQKNVQVLLLDTFLTGESENFEVSSARKQDELFFATYNVTDTQARVQDILTATSYLKKKRRGAEVVVCGMEKAGLWALLAAPGVDAVLADCHQLNVSSDEEFLQPDLFVPGLRKLGGFATVLNLAQPNPTLLHNTGTQFSPANAHQTAALNKLNLPTSTREKATSEKLVEWIASLK